MAGQHADYWLAEFSLNDESHHLMILQGTLNRKELEAATQRMMDAHAEQHPHLVMKLVHVERMESPEQVDRYVANLKAKYPKQYFADELYPHNPNALLFQPLNADNASFQSGRAEEALIRMLCGG